MHICPKGLLVVCGSVCLLRAILTLAYYVYDYIQSRLFPLDPLTLGEWAVVTGSTDGIGKSFAKEYARRGMNVVLISRTESKLKDVAQEIESLYNVKIRYIQANFTDRNCYEKIKKDLDELQIGVLVNNVGILHDTHQSYNDVSEEFIWNEIDVNCGATAMMTRIVLPQMISRKKGLIVNLSSLAGEFGIPFRGNYAATKSFVTLFTRNLHEEVKNHNVRIRCLTPGFVVTNLMPKHQKSVDFLHQNMPLLCPDPDTYVTCAMHSLNSRSVVTVGYWPHALSEMLFCWLPDQLKILLSSGLFKKEETLS